MGFGIGHPDVALYRMVKSGEAGLNLRLSDMFDKHIEVPDLLTIIKSLFTREKLRVKIKAYPNRLIERLLTIQRATDREIQRELNKAKSER